MSKQMWVLRAGGGGISSISFERNLLLLSVGIKRVTSIILSSVQRLLRKLKKPTLAGAGGWLIEGNVV